MAPAVYRLHVHFYTKQWTQSRLSSHGCFWHFMIYLMTLLVPEAVYTLLIIELLFNNDFHSSPKVKQFSLTNLFILS
jgi:hypothetical protein